MGLDMYVFKIKKSNLSDAVVHERQDVDGLCIREDEIDNPMYSQLKPYCTKLWVQNRYIDFEKIGREFNMKSPIVDGFGDKCYQFTEDSCDMTDRSSQRFVSISDKYIREKYSLIKKEISHVCSIKEVKYWRNAYDLRDWIHETLIARIESCGFYQLSEKFIREYNKVFPEDLIKEESQGESALFYHEWY